MVLQQKISNYPLLLSSSENELKNYTLLANGIGVHWAAIDEDLSLKGF